MDEIKVSVIVPVYNVEQYLEECVDSLVNQTLKGIEILLVDDGATDSSGDICDQYAREYKNIRVIHKANGGLGDARNVGFAEAVGKYIYFIDSDDYLDLDALEFLYNESEQNHLDVLMFSAESFSDDVDWKFDPEGYKRTKYLNEVYSGKELFEKLYSVQEYYASIPLRFYNREFYKSGKYSFARIIHEDEFPAFLSLVEAERAECVEYKFYKRRFRKGSIMTSEKAYKSAVGYAYTWMELIDFYKKTTLECKKEYWDFSQKYLKIIINLYYKSFENNEKIEFQAIHNIIKQRSKGSFKCFDKNVQMFLFNPIIYGYYRKMKQMDK